MIHPAVIEALVAAGATAEMIAAAHRADHAIDERKEAERQAKNAARQKRWRERHPDSVTARNVMRRHVTLHNVSTPIPPKEKSPTPPKEITPLTLPLESANADSAPPSANATELVDWFEGQWNAMAAAIGLGRIKAMTDKRARGIRCRADDLVKALGFADPMAGFVETFNRIRGSPFLRGANGDRAWRCDVDWLLTESNFLKVHEGKYAPDPKQRSSTVHAFKR